MKIIMSFVSLISSGTGGWNTEYRHDLSRPSGIANALTLSAIKMGRFFLIFFAFYGLSCSSHTKRPDIKLRSFKNYALINEDSCRKWRLPITSFKIEYPSRFSAHYNYNDNYLTLTAKDDSGHIQQEFSLGKLENIQAEEEIKKWIIKADSMFNNFKTYKTTFIGSDIVGNKTFFVAKGIINFDGFGYEIYKGNYNVLMLLIPNDKRANGVSMSYINSQKQNDTQTQKGIVDSIINTLEFFKN